MSLFKYKFITALDMKPLKGLVGDYHGSRLLFLGESVSSHIIFEQYTRIQLNTDIIQASIDKALQNDVDTLTNLDILNNLDSEFIKSRIGFIWDRVQTKPEKSKMGISYGETQVSPAFIYIHVLDEFFDNIRDYNNWFDIAEEILDIYTHEAIHHHQALNAKKKNIGFTVIPNSAGTIKEQIDYYSNIHEIDAYAEQCAYQLIKEYHDADKIVDMLGKEDTSLQQNKIYHKYYTLFALMYKYEGDFDNKDMQKYKYKSIDVWKRFKRRLYEFIKGDMNSIFLTKEYKDE